MHPDRIPSLLERGLQSASLEVGTTGPGRPTCPPNGGSHRRASRHALRSFRSGLKSALLGLLAVIFLGVPTLSAAPDAQQVISLASGWNLISIQVGGPLTPAAFAAELSHPDRLQQIWEYNPTGNPGTPGQWNTFQLLQPPEFPSDVTQIVPGRGYWVRVSQATTLDLTGPAWSGPVSIVPGWNLVGFPGLDLGGSEQQELASVFGSSFDRIQQVWTHDNASKLFSGYDLTAIPQLRQVTGVQPGRAYWVYSIAPGPIALQGQPWVALPADSDASPPQPSAAYVGTNPKYVGKQVRLKNPDGSDDTYDLNGNGILDAADTQDTILFEKTSDSVTVTVGNLGGGVLPWSLENGVGWLYTAPADRRTWPDGATSRPKGASGSVSSEKDAFTLYVDRAGMSPERMTGDLTLWVGGQAFPIHVLLDVASIDGDWRGFATTTRVGGRNVSLGEVRLVLNSSTNDGGESSGFRAVLNREQSILFPRDVYMDGVFFTGNQFKLTTNFEMKAGDRNAPPYDTFPGDPKDRDFNNNGKVDLANPFPFGIRREVTLLGTRVSPDRLEGTYIESIRGMLPPTEGNNLATNETQFKSDAFLTRSQPVFIEGTFVLDRQSFAPTKRSIFNERAEVGLSLGGSETTTRTATFNVASGVNVKRVTLSLGLTFPSPELIQIRLIAPDGRDFIVHEYGNAGAPPASITIPDEVFDNMNAAGEWTLQIEWDGSTGERGVLESWGLDIEGKATQIATGRMVRGTGNPEIPIHTPIETIAGAAIRLEGGVTTATFTSGPDGTFTIPELTENDYTLFISKPGYETASVAFFVSDADQALGDLPLVPLAITEPRLTAAPPVGYAGNQPLHVEFTVDTPLGFGGTTIAWDFNGDNTPDQSGPVAELSEVSHDYGQPGYYTAKVTLSGGTLPFAITKDVAIHVHRGIADPGGGNQQILVNTFVGSLAARSDATANNATEPQVTVQDSATDPVTYLGPATVNLQSGSVYQESINDPSAFDADRIPLAPGASFPGQEDLDLTPNHPALRYLRFNQNSTLSPVTKYEALTYSATPTGSRSVESNNTAGITTYTPPAGTTKPNRFRIVTALGGAVFSTEPSAVGAIKIHPGRTLP
ncbi:MAG: carboxypeptidase regulatory-like domain-containing protein [Verrucomicrobia bacterium]|nr:carboxypeptidase regulatory-like domain-containing protein [Verrucomicrobiota bacterium]